MKGLLSIVFMLILFLLITVFWYFSLKYNYLRFIKVKKLKEKCLLKNEKEKK